MEFWGAIFKGGLLYLLISVYGMGTKKFSIHVPGCAEVSE